MHHIQGMERDQLTLFPDSLDEYISEENPVRFIDAYLETLDLRQLGFRHAVLQETGQPPYHPGDLLKLYLYGCLNRVRSPGLDRHLCLPKDIGTMCTTGAGRTGSRQLEREAQRNVEMMWLMRRLAPDFPGQDLRQNHRRFPKG